MSKVDVYCQMSKLLDIRKSLPFVRTCLSNLSYENGKPQI